MGKYNRYFNNEDLIKFPCIDQNGKYVNIDYCVRCDKSESCDIYHTMINEQDDLNN